jgi:hypothetical protein
LRTRAERGFADRRARGAGIAFVLFGPGSLAIIGAVFEGEARGRAIGTWAGVGAITSAVRPVAGGSLVLCAIGAGVLMLAAFVMIEANSRHPMMPLDVFRSCDFTGTHLVTLLLHFANNRIKAGNPSTATILSTFRFPR